MALPFLSFCGYVDFVWHIRSQYIVHVYRKWLRYSASQIDEAPSSWRLVNAQPLPSSTNLRPFSVPFCLPVVPSKTLAVFSCLVIVNEFSTTSFWDLCKFSRLSNFHFCHDVRFVENIYSSPDEILQCLRCEQRRQDVQGFTTLRGDKKSSNLLCQAAIFPFRRVFLVIRRHGSTRGRAFAVGFVNVISLLRVSHAENINPRHLRVIYYKTRERVASIIETRAAGFHSRIYLRRMRAQHVGLKSGMNSREFNVKCAARTNNFICCRSHTF